MKCVLSARAHLRQRGLLFFLVHADLLCGPGDRVSALITLQLKIIVWVQNDVVAEEVEHTWRGTNTESRARLKLTKQHQDFLFQVHEADYFNSI